MTRKALLLWADDSAANLGLRALASGNKELVSGALGEVEVDNQDFGAGDSTVAFGTRSIIKDLGRRNGPIKQKLRQYDLILDTGAGDSFADIYGLKRLMFIAYAHLQTRRLGIPLFFMPQTIGPFRTYVGRKIAGWSVRQARAILVRDSQSNTYLREIFGRESDAVATDVVFLLPIESPDKSRDVILNISGLLWFGDDHVDSSYYREQVTAFVAGCIKRGRSISLCAHVVHSRSGNDDVDAQHDFCSSWQGPRLEQLVPTDLRAARRYLASASVVVGGRMHACLNALSQGVPAIPWAYSRKFEPLMNDLGWHHIVDLRSEVDAAAVTLDYLDQLEELSGQARLLRVVARSKLIAAADALEQSANQ